jgi:hypothetical protein
MAGKRLGEKKNLSCRRYGTDPMKPYNLYDSCNLCFLLKSCFAKAYRVPTFSVGETVVEIYQNYQNKF